jgi:hypothetical protein
MWLAHDDVIDGSYIEKCLTHLANDQNIKAVVGHVVSVAGDGLIEIEYPLLPTRSNVNQFMFESNRLFCEWNLGILIRAVFRTRDAKPIQSAYDDDQFADIIWAYGFCLAHPIVQEPSAVYRKRIYPGSTHSTWDHSIVDPACAPFLLQEIDRSPLDESNRAVCRQELMTRLATRMIHQLKSAHSATNLLRSQKDKPFSSKGRRFTAPIRQLVRYIKPGL